MNEELKAKIQQSLEIIDQAVSEYDVGPVVAMFSGGHDSLCSTHLASQHPRFSDVAMINTTIGIERTRQFVRDTCRDHQWKLNEYTPPVPYREIVLKHGFPGPGGHLFMYSRLKERCVRVIVRRKRHRLQRVALVTGVRLSESTRRMGHVQAIQRVGCQLWVAPILHWSDEDKLAYMQHHQLSRNPVVDTLCMSGECLCGAFARPEEMAEITAAFPEVAAEIRALEVEAREAGVHACWGKRPPGRRKSSKSGQMCHSCAEKVA